MLEAGSHGHKWAGNGYNYWQNSLGCFIAEEPFMLHLGVGRWRAFRMEAKRCGSCECVQNLKWGILWGWPMDHLIVSDELEGRERLRER